MKKYLLLLFIGVMLLPLSLQAEINLETGVYRLEWTVENQGYVGLLVMLSGKEGKMRVKHYDPLTENERIVEMTMRMGKTKQGDALLGYNPIDTVTKRPTGGYSADNLTFRRSHDGQWQVFNVDDQGVIAEIGFSKVSSGEEPLALAEFGWVKDDKTDSSRLQPKQSAKTALEWYNLAQVFEEIDKYEEAVEAYNQVIQTPDPTQAICLGCTWAHRGLCLEQLGKRDEALLSYRKALEIRPDIDFAKKGVVRLIKGERL